jgi:transposase
VYYCIGIDISKASINVHIADKKLDVVYDNSIKGFKSLYSKLKKLYKKEIDKIVFIYEPTGSYSEALRKFCFTQQILCFIINPKQFSNYAKALGAEVKNDIEDARVLSKAIVLAKEGEVKIPHYNEDVELIKELMAYYKLLVKQTTQQKNHLESLSSKDGSKFAIKALKKSIEELKSKSDNVLDEISSIIVNNPQYKNDYENITSITGVGRISGIVLLHLFLKYPEANQRQITSLAGLNPIYKQSGSSIQSKYSISKTGSKLYRGILFMGIMSAVRFDENFKAFYERLLANHKHTTQAQIAVMRKVIIIAHSLYKNDKKYDKNYGQNKEESNE